MLTVKENVRETLKKDGHPDRFVNQFEYLGMTFSPQGGAGARPTYGGPAVQNAWGVYTQWPEGTPGPFPVHTPDKIVIKDIEHWQDYVKVPKASGFSDAEWEFPLKIAENIDKENQFLCSMVAPGLFEQCHHLMEIQRFLMAFYENPDELHDVINVLKDYELEMAEETCSHLHPEAVFHHDDWGSQLSTFISPAMFEDFFVEPYKEIYGYYHDHGVELIVHHADSYCATLVPDMIEIGIDIWQGAMSTNNIPALVEEYKGQIAIMSGIDSAWVDNPDNSRENTKAWVKKVLDQYETPNGIIPCITQGGPMSTFEGVYKDACEEIAAYNQERFGVSSNVGSGFGR